MFRKLLGAAAIVAASPSVSAQPSIEPYAKASPANAIYDLLFCDDLAAFQPTPPETPADWQAMLFGPAPDADKIADLARDATAESRVRALAFNWLRAHGRGVPKGVVLGVVIEVPLEQGLDVLAAYADGSVRYINSTGKMAFVEPGGMPQANAQARRLIDLAGPLVARIGPWDKARLPPPARPNIRLTFIVSDGLYFGEGPFDVMQRDAMAGPLVQQGAQLLTLVVDKSTAK